MELERADAEKYGVAPAWIENFLDRLEEEHVSMHSFLLMRKGKLIYENYYAPYGPKVLHRMFSVTKSIVSLCIGILQSEGRLRLSDRIVDYFPEFAGDKKDLFLTEMTIEDMLKMESCHDKTTFKVLKDRNWVESFFTVKPSHAPGTVFSYDTSSTHTLCALVEKLTGMELAAYMMEKFGRTLGFDERTYCLKDPYGVSMGGSGLMMLPIDLLKLMDVLSNDGVYNGVQLFDRDYVKTATAKLVDTMGKPASTEEMQGYGYQFWQVRHGGFACYGMGGQLAVCLPKKELVFVTTADAQGIQGGVQMIYQAFWQEIYNKINDRIDGFGEAASAEYEKSVIAPVQGEPAFGWRERQLAALPKGIALKDSDFAGKEQLRAETGNTDTATAAYVFGENAMGLTRLSYEIDKDGGKIFYTNQSGTQSLAFAFGKNVFQQFPVYGHTCGVSACLADPGTLWIKAQIIDEAVGTVWMELSLKGNTCTVMMRKIEETMYNEFQGMCTGIAQCQ